jgi:hypothetical protein
MIFSFSIRHFFISPRHSFSLSPLIIAIIDYFHFHFHYFHYFHFIISSHYFFRLFSAGFHFFVSFHLPHFIFIFSTLLRHFLRLFDWFLFSFATPAFQARVFSFAGFASCCLRLLRCLFFLRHFHFVASFLRLFSITFLLHSLFLSLIFLSFFHYAIA